MHIFITLSGVTPASSVFIIVPVALVAAGSGSFLAFVFAAIVGVFVILPQHGRAWNLRQAAVDEEA
jgi:hypothetical protein